MNQVKREMPVTVLDKLKVCANTRRWAALSFCAAYKRVTAIKSSISEVELRDGKSILKRLVYSTSVWCFNPVWRCKRS